MRMLLGEVLVNYADHFSRADGRQAVNSSNYDDCARRWTVAVRKIVLGDEQ